MKLKRFGALARTMATERIIKCRQCGKSIERNVAIELRKGWYVCSDACAEAWAAAHKPKSKQSEPDARKALLEYIKNLDPHANFPAIAMQLKRMIADYGMTYAGIRYALWYSINIKELPYKGIGILPYVYDESRRYWNWKQQMKQQVAGWMPADDDAVIVRRDAEEDVFV